MGGFFFLDFFFQQGCVYDWKNQLLLLSIPIFICLTGSAHEKNVHSERFYMHWGKVKEVSLFVVTLNCKNWPISNRGKAASNTQQLLKYHSWDCVVIPIRQPEGSEIKLYWHQLCVTFGSPECLSCWRAEEELAHADFLHQNYRFHHVCFILSVFWGFSLFPPWFLWECHEFGWCV